MARTDPPSSPSSPPAPGQPPDKGGKRPGKFLESLGKAIVAPIEGAHDTHFHPGVDVPPPAPKAAPDEARHHHSVFESIGKAITAPMEGTHAIDERNPRVVGRRDDTALESFGKAIVAPVEGADEGAGKPGSMAPKNTPKRA